MCLAIPAKIIEKQADSGWVKIGAATKVHVNLIMTPKANTGDWVLIHAGFSIQVVDEDYARETLEIIDDYANSSNIRDTTRS